MDKLSPEKMGLKEYPQFVAALAGLATSGVASWNPGAERLFGYTADEVIDKSVTALIPADRHDEEPKILERIRRGERIDHYETVRLRKDGTLIDISLCVSHIRDAGGTSSGRQRLLVTLPSAGRLRPVKKC